MISNLCFLQCFGTDDWVTGRTSIPLETHSSNPRFFRTQFLVHRLAERSEIWHDDGHLSVAGHLLFGELWSWGPVIPCGDMRHSFTHVPVLV